VFSALAEYELKEVTDKLSQVGNKIEPCIERSGEKLIGRRIAFKDGDEAIFVVNTDAAAVSDTVSFKSDKIPYEIDLFDGCVYPLKYEKHDGYISVGVQLLRGEGIMIYLTSRAAEISERISLGEEVIDLSLKGAYITREYSISTGPVNTYYEIGERPVAVGE